MRSIIEDSYTFLRKDGNTKLIISSHGGQSGKTFQTPITLRFPARQNYCAYGSITRMLSWTDKEYEEEPANTGGLDDYTLSNFEHDQYDEFKKVTEAGFDVVTIQRGKDVKLTHVLNNKNIRLHGYTVVYCMFCRVATQAKYVKVMF